MSKEVKEVSEKIGEEIEEQDGPLSESVQLFKHESYTDGNLVYLDIMTPVKVSKTGKISIDKDKPKNFVGKTQVDFGGRIMPYTFMIEGAKNAKEALDLFDKAMEKALEETKERVESIQKEQEEKQNKIVVPGEKTIVT